MKNLEMNVQAGEVVVKTGEMNVPAGDRLRNLGNDCASPEMAAQVGKWMCKYRMLVQVSGLAGLEKYKN